MCVRLCNSPHVQRLLEDPRIMVVAVVEVVEVVAVAEDAVGEGGRSGRVGQVPGVTPPCVLSATNVVR